MTQPQPERPDWPCGCPNDHAMTKDRAWCGACSEWCYAREGMLCARGEQAKLETENVRYREALERIEEFDAEGGDEGSLDEWAEAAAFVNCQGIARTALQGGEG